MQGQFQISAILSVPKGMPMLIMKKKTPILTKPTKTCDIVIFTSLLAQIFQRANQGKITESESH